MQRSVPLSASLVLGALTGISVYAVASLALPASAIVELLLGAGQFVATELNHSVATAAEAASDTTDEDIESFFVLAMLVGTGFLFFFLFISRNIKWANWTIFGLNMTVGVAGEYFAQVGVAPDTLYAILFLNIISMLVGAFFLLFAGAWKRALKLFGTTLFWFLVYSVFIVNIESASGEPPTGQAQAETPASSE